MFPPDCVVFESSKLPNGDIDISTSFVLRISQRVAPQFFGACINTEREEMELKTRAFTALWLKLYGSIIDDLIELQTKIPNAGTNDADYVQARIDLILNKIGPEGAAKALRVILEKARVSSINKSS